MGWIWRPARTRQAKAFEAVRPICDETKGLIEGLIAGTDTKDAAEQENRHQHVDELRNRRQVREVVVIGSGPAGYTAALDAERYLVALGDMEARAAAVTV
ncbi:hypothetical protein BOQ63_007985 [Streptomyces viridifaciens]|nr:hypothetical protein CP971_01175 [Streptomyces viridifaciens]UKZ03997.1 hypothetical protein BOQ63_007985 [Streptomyces viridifaciens]